MAKKMRKLLSYILALSLCMSLMSLTALAVEPTVENSTVNSTVGPVDAMVTTTTETINNADGTVTTNITIETKTDGSFPISEDTNGSLSVEYQETKESSVTKDSEGNVTQEGSSVSGSEVVTETKFTPGTPATAEASAGDLDVSFGDGQTPIFDSDDNTAGSLTDNANASPSDPQIPEGADPTYDADGNLTGWMDTTVSPAVPGEGNGTDVDGDGIIDTITSQTTTDTDATVESTDRTLDATLTEGAATQEDGAVTTDPATGIGGVTLPEGKTWEEVGATTQAQIAKIQDQLQFITDESTATEAQKQAAEATQLVLDALLNGKELGTSENADVNAMAAELLAAAKAETAAPANPETAAAPEIKVTNVSLTVGDKVDGNSNNNDDNSDNDVYDTSAQFEVIVVRSDLTNKVVVGVFQDGKEVGAVAIDTTPGADNGSNVISDGKGGYSVNIGNMALQENLDIDLKVELNGLRELPSNQLYVYTATTETTTTTTVPDLPEQAFGTPTESSGNDSNDDSLQAISQEITKADNWPGNDSDYTTTNTLSNGAKITFTEKRGTGSDGTESQFVDVVTTENITADYIVVKAANGYLRYEVPGGVLYAGVTYTVENAHNSVIDKKGGISHVTLWGDGDIVNTPTKEDTQTTTSTEHILGIADQQQAVTMGVNMTLNFEVNEATVTTTVNSHETTVTTRNWSDSQSSTVTPIVTPPAPPSNPPSDPPSDPPVPPGGGDDDVVIPDEPTPLAELLEEEVPMEELFDEEVPLAELPQTGDISALWYAMTLLSGGGLLALNKKRKD